MVTEATNTEYTIVEDFLAVQEGGGGVGASPIKILTS